MSSYYVTISYQFENEREQTILLDTVEDVQVQSSSTITEHPVPTGDIVADHMFNNPSSMTIRGAISLAGSSQRVLSGDTTLLINFQELFERIKNEGVLCTIYKINRDTNDIRFMKRQSMALQNISWVERLNSLDFTFTFRQVLTVDIQEYSVDIDDEFLPSVTSPKTLSFTDTLLDWEEVDRLVIKIFHDFNLITDGFLEYLSTVTKSQLISMGVALAFVGSITKIAVALGATGPVGWIVLGVGAAIGAIIGVITFVSKKIKASKYKYKQFKRYEDDRRTQQEVVRFSNAIGEIHTQLQQLDSSIRVYEISSDEEQECLLTIGTNYYIFEFKKNNTSKKYSLRVLDIENHCKKVLSDISGALESFYDCNDQNYLFRADETAEYVYILNLKKTKLDVLSNYVIVTSSIKPSEFNKTVEEIIVAAFKR